MCPWHASREAPKPSTTNSKEWSIAVFREWQFGLVSTPLKDKQFFTDNDWAFIEMGKSSIKNWHDCVKQSMFFRNKKVVQPDRLLYVLKHHGSKLVGAFSERLFSIYTPSIRRLRCTLRRSLYNWKSRSVNNRHTLKICVGALQRLRKWGAFTDV